MSKEFETKLEELLKLATLDGERRVAVKRGVLELIEEDKEKNVDHVEAILVQRDGDRLVLSFKVGDEEKKLRFEKRNAVKLTEILQKLYFPN